MEFMGKCQIANIWKHYGDKLGRFKMGNQKGLEAPISVVSVAFVCIVLAMIPMNY